MSKLAFMCHPAVGHLNALLTIARQMASEGHAPRFLVPGMSAPGFRLKPEILNDVFEVPASVERAGLKVVRLTPPPGMIFHAILLPRTHGHAEMRRAQALFTSGLLGLTHRVLRDLEKDPVDAVVMDFAFLPAQFAAERLGIPFIPLYHSGLPFHGPGVPPFGSGLAIGTQGPVLQEAEARERVLSDLLMRKTGAVRRSLGLSSPARTLRTPASPWLNLIPSHERIEAPRTGLGRSCLYVGPCFSLRRGTAPEPFPYAWLEEQTFKVYLSLGTVFNGRPNVFRTLIQALDQPGVQVVVSAGASYPALSSSVKSERVLVLRRVPQVDLLPRMDLVIGHGGNNSTNETLAAGKPLLVVPVGGEQHDNARRVEYLGVGRSLDFQTMTEGDVRLEIRLLREQPRFAERARELKQHLDRTDGTRVAAALIAYVAKHRAPVVLPEDAPRTIEADALAPLLSRLEQAR